MVAFVINNLQIEDVVAMREITMNRVDLIFVLDDCRNLSILQAKRKSHLSLVNREIPPQELSLVNRGIF